MKIHSNYTDTTFTRDKNGNPDKEAKEVAIVAGGAGATGVATGITKLNKINKVAVDVTKASRSGLNAVGGFNKTKTSFASKILGGLSTFGKKIGIGGFTADLLLTKTSKSIAKGVGGLFAIGTTAFGVAETISAFGNLTKQPKLDIAA